LSDLGTEVCLYPNTHVHSNSMAIAQSCGGELGRLVPTGLNSKLYLLLSASCSIYRILGKELEKEVILIGNGIDN
jgi:hypothetical protein